MTALLHFEEKVHRKGLTRAEAIPLLMPRLLCHVLEHLRFSEEPRIERRQSCAMIVSHERTLSMQRSFLFCQKEDVVDDYAEDLPRDEQPVPVEVEGTSVSDSSPSVLPPTAQLLLRLQACPPRHNSHLSTSLSLLGISWLLWMQSAHFLPLLHLSWLLRQHWPSGWPASRSLSHRIRLFFFRYRATLVSLQLP